MIEFGQDRVSWELTVVKKLTDYDPAEDLGSDEAIAIFMAEAFATEDVAYISHALGVVARAKGMAGIASRWDYHGSSFIGRSAGRGIRR